MFKAKFPVKVPELAEFEAYPNRDSIPYSKIYGIEEAHTVFRGTFRNTGWCSAWYDFVALGLTDQKFNIPEDCKTYGQLLSLIGKFNGTGNDTSIESLKNAVVANLKCSEESSTVIALQWLGYFSDTPLPSDKKSPFEVMVHTLSSKMAYKDGERDMIVLLHRFICEGKDGKKQNVTSTMIDYGIPHGDSAMARTVSLPPAIGVKIICEDKISLTGVQIPVAKEIYEPILKELEELDIVCVEKYTDI